MKHDFMSPNGVDLLAPGTQILPIIRVLELPADDLNLQKLEAVTKALGSATHLEIPRFLSARTCSVLEIAEALQLPPSTAITLHIKVLEKARLIETDLRPATGGLQKVCARLYDRIVIKLPADIEREETLVEDSMPIGAFSDINVTATCGLLAPSLIGL